MKNKLHRRSFLKTGLAACGGIALVPHSSLRAAEQTHESSNETLKTIHSLRTIHGNFSDKVVPDEHIEQIMEASIRAANASNMQTYSIIKVKDTDKMKNLCGYAASCMLVYCVDYNRLILTAKHLGYDYYPDNIINLITGSMNAMLAAQTAVIAAKSLGIDSLMTNGIHRGNIERLWKLLELPDQYCFPLIAVLLGYPTEEPNHKKGRLSGKGIFHEDSYQKLTNEGLEEIVKKTDDKNLHIALNENWDNDGHKNYYDWFFNSWMRNVDKPTSEETQMFKLLKRSGFIDMQK